MRLVRLSCFGCLFAVACSSEDPRGGGIDESARELAGIYQITSHTRNLDGCDPGEEVSIESYLAVFSFDVAALGETWLGAYSCSSEAACRDFVAGWPNGVTYLFGFDFNHGDREEVTVSRISTGYSTEEGVCRAPTRQDGRLLGLADGRIRIEFAITLGDDYPEIDGWCTSDAARRAVAGKACSQFEGIDATKVADL